MRTHLACRSAPPTINITMLLQCCCKVSQLKNSYDVFCIRQLVTEAHKKSSASKMTLVNGTQLGDPYALGAGEWINDETK